MPINYKKILLLIMSEYSTIIIHRHGMGIKIAKKMFTNVTQYSG